MRVIDDGEEVTSFAVAEASRPVTLSMEEDDIDDTGASSVAESFLSFFVIPILAKRSR
jgi:hypothetical protein